MHLQNKLQRIFRQSSAFIRKQVGGIFTYRGISYKISDLENQSAGKVTSITNDQLIPRRIENSLFYYYENRKGIKTV